MKKVCIVAPVHDWDDVRVFQKQAVSLSLEGYEVVLLSRARQVFFEKGVKVVPAKSCEKSRMVRFAMLPLVLVQALRQRAHLYHLHNPDTLPLALVLHWLGRRVIYDSHEDFAQRVLMRAWVPRLLRPLCARGVAAAERMVGSRVDGVLVTQEAVAKRIGNGAKVLGNPPRADQSLVERVLIRARRIGRKDNVLRAVYLGSVSQVRGLIEMVDAIERANEEVPARLWLIGPARPQELQLAQVRPGWRFVDYLGRLPQEEAFAYVSRADVGLVTLRDVGDHRTSDPNKIYEYMTFGIPVIASDFPGWRARLAEVDAGWFVSPGDVNSIAAALIEAGKRPELRAQRGDDGRRYVDRYNWSGEFRILRDVYRRLLETV